MWGGPGQRKLERALPGGGAFSRGHCLHLPPNFSLSSPPSPPPVLQTQHRPEGEPYEAEDFVCDYHLEMLSLSQDQQNPSCIQFDDSNWQLHLTSLKPLGLNVLLNLCDASVTERLSRFSDHLCNVALQESRSAVLPVRVPWGLCELARLIGMQPGDSSQGLGPRGQVWPQPLYLFIYVFIYLPIHAFIYLWLCHVACGILVPQPGVEPVPSAMRPQSLSTGPPGNSLIGAFNQAPLLDGAPLSGKITACGVDGPREAAWPDWGSLPRQEGREVCGVGIPPRCPSFKHSRARCGLSQEHQHPFELLISPFNCMLSVYSSIHPSRRLHSRGQGALHAGEPPRTLPSPQC